MHTIHVKNITIGEGIPKICVSIIGKTREEILKQAEALLYSKADIVEWRVDWYEQAEVIEEVLQTAKELSAVFKEMPWIFTFRTAKEGGEKEISTQAYKALNEAIIKSRTADFVDVEVFMEEEMAKELIKTAHENDTKIVASNHDFSKTPSKEEILRRLCYMQDLGADIPKIAVMPQSKTDVLTLLAATTEMRENYAKSPIITMSMAGEGSISRISGEIFGSAVTFGAVGSVSAPGQIEINRLVELLQDIHKMYVGA
ncbi:MAG: type I 3-dehydroquinate dehydratase [Lachnospiraceae bacterium]|nr:type I 3-dehydroquinate dehydratase [Lachnospiraceae bacterium]